MEIFDYMQRTSTTILILSKYEPEKKKSLNIYSAYNNMYPNLVAVIKKQFPI